MKISRSTFLPAFNHQKQSPEVAHKRGVIKIFAKLTGKHLCRSLFFVKVTDLMTETVLNKTLWYRYFSLNFAKF